MGYPLEKEGRRYTYREYLSWPAEERWELIDGRPYSMSPSPSRIHQKVSGRLFNAFFTYLEGKSCEIYAAPFDVRLPADNEKEEDIDTVVQPDLVVVCDTEKLDEKGCKGAPDLVIEIVSPSSASLDYITKLQLYEKRGVREYWVVHPVDRIVMVYRAGEDGRYSKPEIYAEESSVEVGIFRGELEISLGSVFR